jgi:Probable cobalt transporter subunit (CbtB)
MSTISKQISKAGTDVPKIAVGVLLGILVLGMFAVGYDQGQLAEAFLGSMGIHPTHTQLMFLHEFNHDLRHGAGFPCH